MAFATIPQAIEEIRAGRMLVVVDDEDRENEGDLTMAAQFVTPEAINFMAVHGRGLICLALSPERCDQLHLPLVSPMNTSRFGTAFCESIDAADGVTTGISAADRSQTIHIAMRPVTYGSTVTDEAHLALVHGEVRGKDNILVRMHSRCILGDVFGSPACNCGEMLRASLQRIAEEGQGVIVYLHQSGWGERKHTPM